MGFLSNPKFPYAVRLVQLVFGIGFLILICYAGVHRGWWKIDGPLAVGVITSVATFAATGYAIFTHHRSNPLAGRGKLFTFVTLGVEVILFLLWIATATLMLRPKSGCDPRFQKDGLDFCRADSKNPIKWVDHPFATWTIAIAFSFLEIVSFILSAALVFVHNKSSQVSGA